MDGINLYHIMIKQYKHANKYYNYAKDCTDKELLNFYIDEARSYINRMKIADKLFQSKYHDYISNDMSNKMYECLIYEAEKLQYKIDNLLEKSHK